MCSAAWFFDGLISTPSVLWGSEQSSCLIWTVSPVALLVISMGGMLGSGGGDGWVAAFVVDPVHQVVKALAQFEGSAGAVEQFLPRLRRVVEVAYDLSNVVPGSVL